jgi:hypothetical protein
VDFVGQDGILRAGWHPAHRRTPEFHRRKVQNLHGTRQLLPIPAAVQIAARVV